MTYEKDLSYIYDLVFTKVKYDPQNKTYILHQEDYIPLKLSTKQFQLLKQMCKRQGILLEDAPSRLPSVENLKLFEEYNQINKIILSSGIPKEKHPLNPKRIAIRNQIVLDNIPLVKAIIDRNFEGIQQLPNKDEIYQLGYLMLITYIDNGRILEPKKFTIHISSKLIFDIKEKILNSKYNISDETNTLLQELRKIQSNSDLNAKKNKEQLATALNIEIKKVETLANLDRFLTSLSIDEEIKLLGQTKESQISSSPMYDDSFEQQLIKNTARDVLIQIINTLPQNQKEVLMLSYGFIDGRCYNDTEIANRLGLTKARIGIIRHTALDNLRLSIRSQYMLDFSEKTSIDKLPEANQKQLKNLEEILVGLIPQEELLNYLINIPKLERDLLTLYYGLIDGKKYSVIEISKILNISKSTVIQYKSKSYENLKTVIEQTNNQQFTNYQEYLEYLIDKYVIHSKNKRKK